MYKKRILVVDDHKTNILYLKKLLDEYDVIEANDGRTALRRVVEDKPDLIVMDTMMSGVDGYSVLSILKKAPETCLIPIILITTFKGVDEKIKSFELGADEYITKPFNSLELQARVKSLLRIKALQDELENVRNIVLSLAATVEAKDIYSANHSIRTAYYADIFSKRINLANDECENMKIAGLLHDIGKIGVKDEVLNKADALNSEEFDMFLIHPVLGEKICCSISAFKSILPYIRHHHERYNGKGYPDGLLGEEIPLGARILAICDAFDALTTDRPYRKAYKLDKALKIMRENEGPQWDPVLLYEFCNMIESKPNILDDAILFSNTQNPYKNILVTKRY